MIDDITPLPPPARMDPPTAPEPDLWSDDEPWPTPAPTERTEGSAPRSVDAPTEPGPPPDFLYDSRPTVMKTPEPPPQYQALPPPPEDLSAEGAFPAAQYSLPGVPPGRAPQSDRPSYLDDTPALEDRLTPEGARRRDADLRRRQAASRAASQEASDESEAGGPPVMVVAGGMIVLSIVLVGGLLAIAGILFSGIGRDGGAGAPATERTPVSGGLEVRETMTREPSLIGAEPTPTEDNAPAAAPAAPTPARRARRAEPRPQPKPKDAAPVTLKIRANRRVLVYVDGQAVGYTPQDHVVKVGAHTITALVPGQPGTKQTRQAEAGKAGATVAVDFAF